MATSSLIRLLTALLMLTGLALSSSLAWAQETAPPSAPSNAENQQPVTQPAPSGQPDSPSEAEISSAAYDQQSSRPDAAWLVTRDALLGGIFGTIIGTTGYFISGRDWNPLVIVYSAAGGIVLGAAVGLVDVFTTDEDRQFSASLQYLQRDLPHTLQLPVVSLRF